VRYLLRLLLLILVSLPSAWAAPASEYLSLFGAGGHFYTGDPDKSFTGASGYFLTFQAEKRKGVIRPTFLADFHTAGGTAYVGADRPEFRLWGAGFQAGVNLFFPIESHVQPFVGAQGVVLWDILKLLPAPAGVLENTDSICYGYAVSAGTDLWVGRGEGFSIRVQGSLWTVTGKLAGITGFQMNGFRITLGVGF
jgi:hypothetical protein